MRFVLIFIFLLFICKINAVYDHRPGERYQTLLPSLNPEQSAQVKQIIYDQSQTKGQIFEHVKEWIRNQTPTTQYYFIRSQLDYKQKDEARNKALDAMETMVSDEARQFNAHIRRIYDDQQISDRQTCESVSSAIIQTTGEIRQQLNIEAMDCTRVFDALAH